jgi:hypothetical protein
MPSSRNCRTAAGPCRSKADHPNPSQHRQLRQHATHPAGSRTHQDGAALVTLPLLQRERGEGVPCGLTDQGEAAADRPGKLDGEASEQAGIRLEVGLERAIRNRAEHPFPPHELGDTLADRLHDAGQLAADPGGHREGVLPTTLAPLRIGRIQPGGSERDPHLSRPGIVQRLVEELEHLWSPEAREADDTVELLDVGGHL